MQTRCYNTTLCKVQWEKNQAVNHSLSMGARVANTQAQVLLRKERESLHPVSSSSIHLIKV